MAHLQTTDARRHPRNQRRLIEPEVRRLSTFGRRTTGQESGQVDGIGAGHANAPVNHVEALARAPLIGFAEKPNWQPAAVGHQVVKADHDSSHQRCSIRRPAQPGIAPTAETRWRSSQANFQGINATESLPMGYSNCMFRYRVPPGSLVGRRSLCLARNEFHAAGVRRYGFRGLSYESIVGSSATRSGPGRWSRRRCPSRKRGQPLRGQEWGKRRKHDGFLGIGRRADGRSVRPDRPGRLVLPVPRTANDGGADRRPALRKFGSWVYPASVPICTTYWRASGRRPDKQLIIFALP